MLRAAAAASGIFSLPEETTGHCNFANETAGNNPGKYRVPSHFPWPDACRVFRSVL
jgi:hypothetical protein